MKASIMLPKYKSITAGLIPYNKLPIRCNNERGLIVEKSDTPRWISLENPVSSIEKNMIRMKLDTLTMDIVALVSILNTEYQSYSARKRFKNDSSKIKEYYSDRIGDIGMSKTINYDRIELPYSMHFETRYETEKLDNNVVIKPFLNLPLPKNKLTQKGRTYPVDFIYPWEYIFESTLEIPSNYSIANIPDGYKLANELAEINLNYSLDKNILIVKGNYKFKKSIYIAREYARIKYYFDQIVKEFNQPIVLERSN
ncbi:MAG: hypothetical protein RIA69_04970 [Cyclobacteriaceae bacterium]